MNQWRKGSSPSADVVVRFANYFNVSTDYLLKGGETNMSEKENEKKENEKMKRQTDIITKELVKDGLDDIMKRFEQNWKTGIEDFLSRTGISEKKFMRFQDIVNGEEFNEDDYPTRSEFENMRVLLIGAGIKSEMLYRALNDETAQNEKIVIEKIGSVVKKYDITLSDIALIVYNKDISQLELNDIELRLLNLLGQFDDPEDKRDFIGAARKLALDFLNISKKSGVTG